MIRPRFAGLARNRASCQSPTVSKANPVSQATQPMAVTTPGADCCVMPAGSGRHATHKISSCGR